MDSFTSFLEDVFVDFGDISVRKMFGGYGVYHQGTMFGLIADDILYLKADDTISSHFYSRDLPQFEYPKSGKIIKMSYYQAPDEIFEDTAMAACWARSSYACALKTKKNKTKK